MDGRHDILKNALRLALADFKETPAWARIQACLVKDISLDDLATDLVPLVLRHLVPRPAIGKLVP